MRLPVEDIKTVPTEVHFVEHIQELNRILARGGDAEYFLTVPLEVSLTYMRSGEDLLFTGTIQGQFSGQCVRCLEDCSSSLFREFSLVLSRPQVLGREVELSADELSASFYNEETIDVSALVQEQALLALPGRLLCREECRGLCAQCGTNLNVEPCECQPAWKDPRLAILSTLRIASSGAPK